MVGWQKVNSLAMLLEIQHKKRICFGLEGLN